MKSFYKNIITATLFQLISILCNFILPRIILNSFGSEVNGLVNSINQFLAVISLGEIGVGAVIQSSLYKPIIEQNGNEINNILTSSKKFYLNLTKIFIVYCFTLCLISRYIPSFNTQGYGAMYVGVLVVIMGCNTISLYILGNTSILFLQADQKTYVYNWACIITLLINLLLTVLLINIGVGIHGIKLATTISYLIKPGICVLYVKKNYAISFKENYEGEPIQQKWDGVFQHLSYYINNSTDIVVLTFFSTLTNVSIYSIYILILNGIKQISTMVDSAIRPMLGNLWVEKNNKKFFKYFRAYEWIANTVGTITFGCTNILIIQFVKIYTRGIDDANYIVPLFALALSGAFLLGCYQNAYHIVIQSMGIYKESGLSYLLPAVLNVLLSIILVTKFSLIGVAIATFAANFIQYIWQGIYINTSVLKTSIGHFIRTVSGNVISCFIVWLISKSLYVSSESYLAWGLGAIKVFFVTLVVTVIINSLFCLDDIKFIMTIIRRKKKNA